jgi:hypothetical protein
LPLVMVTCQYTEEVRLLIPEPYEV